MNRWLAIFVCVLSGWPVAWTEEPVATLRVTQPAEGPVSQSIEREARVAVTRGIRWLIARQNPNGGWSDTNDLSTAALSLLALVQGGCVDPNIVDRAIRRLTDQACEDGSFRAPSDKSNAEDGSVLPNTALCALALHAAGNPESIPTILNIRHYLADMQTRLSTGSAMLVVFEAMRQTASFENARPDERTIDFNWSAAADRIARLLDHPTPDLLPADSLLLLLLTGVHKEDPRVRSALEAIPPLDSPRNNLDRSRPDYFSCLYTRAKALSVFGLDTLVDREGRRVNWREETILALIGTQKIEPGTGFGFWEIRAKNAGNTDPIRSTAYAILTLQLASRPQGVQDE